MTIAASIQFTQGANVGGVGNALLGVLTTPVVVANGNNTGVKAWNFEVQDVPPGSAVGPVSTNPNVPVWAQAGGQPTFTFAPDKTGGYTIRIRVFDQNGNFADDVRVFQIAEPSGRIIVPFRATDLMLNFFGTPIALATNLRGYAPFLEQYLRFVDSLGAGTAIVEDVISITQANSPYTALVDTVTAVDGATAPVIINIPSGMTSGAQAQWVGLKLRGNPATNSVTVNAPSGKTIENPPGIGGGLGTFSASVLFNLAGQLGSSVYWRQLANGNLELR